MSAPTAAPRRITRDEFRSISELLREHTGIRLVPGKENLVMARLYSRMCRLGLATYGEYVGLLRDPEQAGELRLAIDLLTTNETSFFRQAQHFEYLSRVIAPTHRESRPFRLWSAACSSGEEAYSAAMVLAERMANRPWEILGVDISSRVVQTAQRGLYPIASAADIPPPLLRKYCRKGRDEYHGMMAVGRELRSNVDFVCANLLEDVRHFGRFDVIMLRNVMIYFGPETKQALVSRLEEMLFPGGYFFVSLSETISGMTTRLQSVGGSVYRMPGADQAGRRG